MVIRPRSCASSGASATSRSMSASHSSARSGSRSSDVALSLPPPQPGLESSNSVRAMQSRNTRASRERSAMCSTRSTKSGSAHWRSSTTTTCGRSAARTSRSRRNASCVSGGDVPMTESGSTPSATRISTSGQYVMPSPYERHRPRRRRPSRPRARESQRRGATSRCRPARAA